MRTTQTYTEFMKQRQEWLKAVTAQSEPGDIICDPGEEIVCDRCNEDALRENLTIVIVDSYALCEACDFDQQQTQHTVGA